MGKTLAAKLTVCIVFSRVLHLGAPKHGVMPLFFSKMPKPTLLFNKLAEICQVLRSFDSFCLLAGK